MSIRYLLDGYNIVHQLPASKQATLEEQRRGLIRLIEERSPQGSRNNQVTIVFDGNPEAFGGMDSQAAKVVFSQGESADDRIRALVAESANVKNIVVVTDDRELQYAVRALGARTRSVKAFLAVRPAAQKKPKRSGSSATVLKEYLPKTDEANITSEMGKIWLKRKNDT